MNFHNFSRMVRTLTSPIEGWCSDDKIDTLVSVVLGFKPVRSVEIGVFAGKSLCAIGLALKEVGSGTVVGIDSWRTEDVVAAHDQQNDKDWWAGHGIGYGNTKSVLEQRYQEAHEWIETLGVSQFAAINRLSSDEAVGNFENESLDLIHLDANKSFVGSNIDLALWFPKLKVGGILVYDDVDWPTIRAAYMRARQSCRELFEMKDRGERGTQGFAILQKEKELP